MNSPNTFGSAPVNTLRGDVTRPRQYMVAANENALPAGFEPLTADVLLSVLQKDPSVHFIRTIQAPLQVASLTPQPLNQVVVAAMSDATAAELARHPQVLVEEDELLRPVLDPSPVAPGGVEDPSLFTPFGTTATWSIRVVDDTTNQPVAAAAVYLYGSGLPVQGTTDASGTVQLSLLNDTDASIKAIYVNPRTDYWNLWADQPPLIAGQINQIQLTPFATTLRTEPPPPVPGRSGAGILPTFPNGQVLGWGEKLMGLDQLPAALDGSGVHVAVIDSGCAARTHPDLSQINDGEDLTVTPSTPTGWDQDTIAHGSHCSGVIAGLNDGHGIRGFAPGATLHELRVFPGGRLSSLLDALDYCIDNNIDVVNMSLGGGGSSQLALQKLNQAKQQGIACIVAAGNTAGPVAFPGSSPDVLTVAAIGKLGEYPDNSYHAKLQWTGGSAVNDLFSAQFSCHGPEVDVCAPGVAVISSVPDQGYAAWDGTSMAAPHITGLAALLLAHHPDLKGAPRGAARVDRLFNIITSSATPLNVGDQTRTGAGVPDATKALAAAIPPDPFAGKLPWSTSAAQPSPAQHLLDLIKDQLTAAGVLN